MENKERFVIIKNTGEDSNIYPYKVFDRKNGYTMEWCYNISDAGRKLTKWRNA